MRASCGLHGLEVEAIGNNSEFVRAGDGQVCSRWQTPTQQAVDVLTGTVLPSICGTQKQRWKQ
jgi:hypothetical protein